MKEVYATIKEILAYNLALPKARIHPAARLAQDLGADSLDRVELITQLEEEFDIEITDEDAEKMKRVQDVVVYVERRKK